MSSYSEIITTTSHNYFRVSINHIQINPIRIASFDLMVIVMDAISPCMNKGFQIINIKREYYAV
jgi:hypothetical protein